MKLKKIIPCTIFALVIALILGYIGMYSYLNMAKYTEHVDSDIASEAMLAREIWEQKDISPDTWVSSTERKILSLATIAAVFYGITGNMNGAMGFTCILGMLAILISFIYLLKAAKLSWKGIAVAILLIMALPMNGMRVRDEMLPYLTYMFYTFAGYYVPYIVLFLLALGIFIKIHKGEDNKKTFILAIFTWIFAMPLGASGLHSAQIAIAPMFVLAIVMMYFGTERFKIKPSKEMIKAVVYVGGLGVCTILGLLYPSSSSFATYMLEPALIPDKLLSVFAGILECLGISGGASLTSFGGIMQLMMWLVLILAGCSLIYLSKMSSENPVHTNNVMSEKKLLVGGMVLSLAITMSDGELQSGVTAN